MTEKTQNVRLLKGENGSTSTKKEFQQTHWKNIIAAAFVNFFSCTESTIIMNAQWPYLQQLDKSVSPTFMGTINSANRANHAVFAVLFGILAVRSGKLRSMLLIGRFLSILASIFFIQAEKFGESAKYALLIAYPLYAISDSTLMLLRGYFAAMSTTKDRATAFAVFALSNMSSIIFGGGTILGFSTIFNYPGYHIFGVHLHVYTVPAVAVIVFNIISTVIILTMLNEAHAKEKESKSTNILDIFKAKGSLSSTFKHVSIGLVLLCFFEKIVVSTSLTTVMSVTSPLATDVFGWDGAKTLQTLSATFTAIGILAICAVAGFMVLKLGQRIPTWKSFLVCVCAFAAYFAAVYPNSLSGWPITIKSEMSPFGCDPSKYDWCDKVLRPDPSCYFLLTLFVFGIFFPLANVTLDTVYSNILGDVDQSLMQSTIIAFDDVIQIVAPVIVTHNFVYFSHSAVSLVQGVVASIGALLWILNAKKLDNHCRKTCELVERQEIELA